jgi:hypothetical protein
VNGTYYLPDMKSSSAFVRGILGGWETGGIFTATSGASHTVFQNGVQGGNGLQALIGTGYNEPQRPLITGIACDAGRSGNQLYNQAAFTLIGYQIGTLPANIEPRGYCKGPGMVNMDFSVDKNWKVTERFGLQFRMDFFDLFNHPNFRGDQVQGYTVASAVTCGPGQTACSPVNNVVSGQTPTTQFGASTGSVSKAGREMQYTLKLTF